MLFLSVSFSQYQLSFHAFFQFLIILRKKKKKEKKIIQFVHFLCRNVVRSYRFTAERSTIIIYFFARSQETDADKRNKHFFRLHIIDDFEMLFLKRSIQCKAIIFRIKILWKKNS